MSNFDRREWTTSDISVLGLEPTAKDDPDIVLRLGVDASVITAKQARELAAELARRADRIDPPVRRWTDVPRTPTSIIGDFLSSGKSATEHVWGDKGESVLESAMRSAHVVSAFTVVALMAELEVVAPARAAALAELLADAWDDGGSVHELIWEWHHDHTTGKQVGFEPEQVLELEVTRDA